MLTYIYICITIRAYIPTIGSDILLLHNTTVMDTSHELIHITLHLLGDIQHVTSTRGFITSCIHGVRQ